MSFLDKLSFNHRTLVIGVFTSVVGSAILWVASYMYEQEDFWWMAGLVLSVFLNVTLIFWILIRKQAGEYAVRLTNVHKREIEKITTDSLKKAELVESLNEQNKMLQERLNNYHSKLVLPSEPEGSHVEYVTMIHCEKHSMWASDIMTNLSIGHKSTDSTSSPVRLSRFDLKRGETIELCRKLANILGWSLTQPAPKSSDDVEITDDDIPF